MPIYSSNLKDIEIHRYHERLVMLKSISSHNKDALGVFCADTSSSFLNIVQYAIKMKALRKLMQEQIERNEKIIMNLDIPSSESESSVEEASAKNTDLQRLLNSRKLAKKRNRGNK
jgi:hypothetical protein